MSGVPGGLEIVYRLFEGWRGSNPTLKVEAEMAVERGLTAEVCRMEIELIEDVSGIQAFDLRMTVDRADGTVGIHRRTLHGFDSKQYNAVALLARAFDQFTDVGERDS